MKAKISKLVFTILALQAITSWALAYSPDSVSREERRGCHGVVIFHHIMCSTNAFYQPAGSAICSQTALQLLQLCLEAEDNDDNDKADFDIH